MQRTRARRPALALALLLAAGLGAAPATPSYQGVLKSLDKLENRLKSDDVKADPYNPGWAKYATEVRASLRTYTEAPEPDTRVEALKRLYNLSNNLDSYGWAPATELREEMRTWLRPRIALAWAEYRLLEALADIPEAETGQRDQWRTFVRERLRPALHDLEAADSVSNRLLALDKVYREIDALQKSNDAAPWSQSVALQSAVADLYNRPDLEVAIDGSAVSNAVMKRGIVEPGWIFFKGQWSYVTPGPLVGVGFVPTADGIQVAVSQALTSTTPIQGFQQQVAQDDQGRRAAKLYEFNATTQNNAVLTTTVLFRLATGVQIAPGYQHGISAAISSVPQEGNGLGRFVASLIGFNQRKITDKVYEGAIPQIRQQVVESASELAGIKAGQAADQINSQLRPYVLDGQTIATRDIGLTGVSLSTFPNFARISGKVMKTGNDLPRGASFPQPRSFETIQGGVTVDVNLPSVLSSVANGYLQGEAARDVNNLMIVTRKPADGQPSADDVTIERNVDYATYLAKVKESRADASAKSQAIRVFKPEKPVKVAADANGNLVVFVPDFTIEVPAPEAATRGGGLTGPAAQVYRIKASQAEFQIAFELQADPAGGAPRIVGKVVGFDGGGNVQVLAINEDEAQAQALNAFTARVISAAFGTQMTSLPIDQRIDALANAPVALMQASELDPTGWMRVVVQPR